MLYLRKIKELKGYRFFQDYKWDENSCKLFAQNNLIYGWNGSGKTTLCDFFKDLEDNSISVDNAEFSLLFENSATKANISITKNKLGTLPYVFKVFHQHYIQENISKDNVKHIFTVGKGQAEKIAEIKRLKALLSDHRVLASSLSDEKNSLIQEFDRLKIAKAKNIKDAANYSNAYNKHKYYEAHNALSSPKILSDDDYQKLLTAIRTQPMTELPEPSYSFIMPTVKEYVIDILKQTPVNNTIEELKKDVTTSHWVEQGLSLHDEKGSKICLFCGSQIDENRFEQLRSHFNKSYKELSDKIDMAIALLRDKSKQFENAKNSLPNQGLLYQEFQKTYQQYVEIAKALCDHYITIISEIIVILENKKSNMISDELIFDFLPIIEKLSFDYSIFEKIKNLISNHNKKSQDFDKSIRKAQSAIELHLVSCYADETNQLERKIEESNKKEEKQNSIIKKCQKDIDDLEREVRNSQIPADEINRDIAFIMGRSELIFTNTDLGYRITRNGKLAKNLSKGEENAIALIYFFNSLNDIDVNSANAIVVLDDPISSFDSNFYYNAISYIREKTLSVGQTFIFTHKFALLKDLSMMYKDNTNKYSIQRIQNTPKLENEHKLIDLYHDEYAYLFKMIYDFVKSPPKNTSDFLQYPNIARRVLEGFLTFKLPSNSTMMDKVLELEKGRKSEAGRAIMRLLNNHSHLRVISTSDLADDIDSIAVLPDTLNHLMEFIKSHDKLHYDTLASISDPEYNPDGCAVDVVREIKRTVTYFTMTASAGPGDFLDENPSAKTIEVSNKDCTYAVKISGDSMEPEVHDGDIVLVKKCDEMLPAHIGIVSYKGVCYCKKLVPKDGKFLLVSLNKGYDPIPVESLDEYHLFGEVVEIIHAEQQ